MSESNIYFARLAKVAEKALRLVDQDVQNPQDVLLVLSMAAFAVRSRAQKKNDTDTLAREVEALLWLENELERVDAESQVNAPGDTVRDSEKAS